MRTALIGFGKMGRNHYRVLKGIPGIELIAVCDPFLDEDIEEKLYNNIDALLKGETIDAAIICAPTNLHKDIAIKCIENNIHILIEKPIATTAQEGHEIKEAAKSKNVKAVVGHVERFNPVVSSLMNELRDKDILSINITRIGPFPPRMNDIGILVDLSVHDIDLIRILTNKSEFVKSSVMKSLKISDAKPDNAILAFTLDKEIVASITTNWLTPFKKRTIEVATKESYFEANLITQELVEYSSFQINNSYVVRECFVKKGEPLLNELSAFKNYINDGDMSLLATLDDGIYPLDIIGSN